jgi:serine/threonine protein kinase
MSGTNLEFRFEKSNYYFPITTASIIGLQVLSRLETFHSEGFIHRDVKPENVYLTFFFLCYLFYSFYLD